MEDKKRCEGEQEKEAGDGCYHLSDRFCCSMINAGRLLFPG